MHMLRGRSLPALLLTALVVAACGGTAATATPSPTPTPTPTPTATPTPSATAALPSTPTAGGGPLGDAAAALEDVSSYRLRAEVALPMTGGAAIGITGTIVLEPEEAAEFTLGTGGSAGGIGYVIIGDEAWSKMGDTYTPITDPATLASAQESLETFKPVNLLGSFASGLADLEVVGDEVKNGVETTRYTLPEEALAQLGTMFGGGEDFSFDVWIARDDGYLVSMVMAGESNATGTPTALGISVDIEGINDPANVIERPS